MNLLAELSWEHAKESVDFVRRATRVESKLIHAPIERYHDSGKALGKLSRLLQSLLTAPPASPESLRAHAFCGP